MVQKKLNDTCDLCGQKLTIYTKSHKHIPFVDNKLYDKLCFTCCLVPKTSNQIYNSNGTIKEIVEIPYSKDNLFTAKELFIAGSCDSLKEATISVDAVVKSIKSSGKTKTKKSPEFVWSLA